MDNVSIKLKVGAVEIPSNPVFGDDVKMKVSQEGEQIFKRVKIDGKIKFVGADFDFIASCSNETELTLSFYRGSSLVGTATFIKADCDLNYADKVASVKLTTTDRYDKILGGLDNKYNLVKLAPVIWPITLYRRPVLQFYMLGDTKITNYIGNVAFEEDASEEAENMNATQIQNCAFSKVYSYLTLNIVISTSMEFDNISAVRAVAGIYSATFTGTVVSRLDCDSGYSIRRVYDSLIGSNVYKFYDSNGNVVVPFISDGEGGRTDYVLHAVFDQSSNSSTGTVRAAFSDGEGSYSEAYVGSLTSAARTIFCRMIHNYSGTISGHTTVTLANLSTDVAERNYNFLYGTTVAGFGIENGIFASTEVQDAPTEYGINGEGKYFVAPAVASVDDVMIPIAWNMWIPMSWWFEGGPWIYEVINSYWKSYILNDAYPLWSCIQRLLNEVDSSISFDPYSEKHHFFGFNGNEESHYIPSPQMRGNELFITPITNVKKTFYEQAAQRGDITLKQIFDMLRKVFRVYWWIDDDNALRLEHIEYFKNNQSYVRGIPDADLDVTAMKDMPNGLSWAFNQEEVSFDRTKRPHRYEFKWGDESTVQFQGYAIDIESKEASQDKTEKVTVENFVADIDYITIRPSNLSDDLWVLMEGGISAGGSSPHKMPWCEIAMHQNDPLYSLLNGFLSFMFIEKYYWKYDMGGWKATCNGGEFNVEGTAQYARQTINHPIPLAQVGGVGAVKTNLGVGIVTEQEIALDTLYAKTKLLLNDERDLYDRVAVTSSGTHTRTVSITNNFWDTVVFKYAVYQENTGETSFHELTINPNGTGTFTYVPSIQSWRKISVVRLSSFLQFCDPVKEGSGSNSLSATMNSHSTGYADLEMGGTDSYWIYVCLKCEKRTRINLYPTITSLNTYGYVGRKPSYNPLLIPDDENVLAYIGNSGQAQYIAEAGEVVYLGFAKSGGAYDDTVEFEIEVPE